MKTAGISTILSSCTLVLGLLTSCATPYIPTDASVKGITPKQAKEQMKHLVLYARTNPGQALSRIGGENGAVIEDIQFTATKVIFKTQSGDALVIPLGDLPPITYPGLGPDFQIGGKNLGLSLDCIPEPVANDLYVLNQHAKSVKQAMAAYDARFRSSLPDYRRLIATGAPLPQQADMYRVQAEGAVRDKHFDEAEELYGKAVDIAPWWPQGHFNRALVYDATGDYDQAIVEMNYYLQLVPDAPNAKSVQYKVYDWQRRVNEQNTHMLTFGNAPPGHTEK